MQAALQRALGLRLPSRPGATTLRRRVLAAIMSATVLALVLFAVPLAWAVERLSRGEQLAQLQRDAVRVATAVPDTLPDAAFSVPRPNGVDPRLQIGVYTAAGARIAGAGPATSRLAAAAHDGRLHAGTEAGELSVSAPVPSDGAVDVTVRIASGVDDARDRVLIEWGAITGAALFAVAVAALLARRHSSNIARPLERLQSAATALGRGERPEPVPTSGIIEADEAATALATTADKLGAAMRRQRAFSRDVSHQLRTPLTRVLLGLESALARPDADLHAAITVAVSRLAELEHIVEEVLHLTEPDVSSAPLAFDDLAADVANRWRGIHAEAGRRLNVLVGEDLPEVRAPAAAVRQIVDVLISNALRHGAGQVTVAVHRIGDGVGVDVGDEGGGFRDASLLEFRTDAQRGHGLRLARELAELAGGTLVFEHAGAPPILRLLLPGRSS